MAEFETTGVDQQVVNSDLESAAAPAAEAATRVAVYGTAKAVPSPALLATGLVGSEL